MIRDLPTNTPPPELFHYTSAAGLCAILRDKKLRASSVRFVNDWDELHKGIELTRHLLEERATAETVEGVARSLNGLATRLGTGLLARDPDMFAPVTICAFSLSRNGDQLSQWRAYCPQEGGYAIGVDSGLLQRSIERTDWKLIRCRYSAVDQQELLAALVNWIHEMAKADPVNLLENFWRQLLPYAAAIKNEAFKEEDEWRLVSAKRTFTQLKVRHTAGLLIPYDEIDISGAPVIRRIRVGPNPHLETAVIGTTAAVASNHLMIRVEHSTIPYRVVR